jgi:AcrR family transcriptional regulator
MSPVSGAQMTGRPVRLPRSARRKQLLAAAQEVFVAQGYHAAAMDDIAERAGVSKPVLYQHFPGKLDLYLALLDTHCDAIVERVRDAMKATSDNKQRVTGAVGAYFDFVDHESEAFRLVFESDLRNEPAVRERVMRVEKGCSEAITETIMSDTGVSRSRAELLAAGLCGASEIAARSWLTSGRKVPKTEAVAMVAALNWRGIAGFPLQSGDNPASA